MTAKEKLLERVMTHSGAEADEALQLLPHARAVAATTATIRSWWRFWGVPRSGSRSSASAGDRPADGSSGAGSLSASFGYDQ